MSLPAGGVDVGGINWLLSDPYTNQTFIGMNGNRIVITGFRVPNQICTFRCLADMNWSIGGVDSSGIDHGSTGILDNPNELEAPKRVGKSAADVDKCYNWSSIFLITMTGQCYHSEYSEQVSNETGEGQSNRNLDSQDSDEHQDVADSEDDFFTSRIAVDFCWVIGCFISLLCLVKTYSWACKEQKRKSRPVICVPMHTLAARTEATSMCCWKGRRQSCAVARFRKAFRKWRWDSVLVWHQRSSMILGGIFLFVLMFQPVVEGSALASQAASVSRTADQRPNLDLGQLAQLDIDPVLLQFIGNVVTDLKEVKTELHVVKNDNMALKHMTQVLETKNLALQNRTQILEVENKVVRAELKQVKLDKAAFENKIRVIQGQNVALHAELSKALIVVAELQNRTRTNSVRLDQCEADAHPFIKEMQASQRRRLQEEETLCRGSGLTAMFEACCPSGSLTGNGHRILQLSEGCDALPQTCSASCAPLFIEYFEGCQGIIDDLAPDQREMFVGFYGGCQEVEQATVAMLEDARPAMIFHVVVMNEVAAQQAQMFGGGNAPAPPVGPIGPLPPSPSPAGGAEIAQEFRRVCTTANLTVCVPQCNRLTYGFLLSIEIDGRGTVMTCNVIDLLYAWVGQASLGGIHRRCVCSVLFVGSVWSGRDIHGDDHGKPRRAH
eukprot:SAG31_NODE_422_length_15859_cov_5.161865_4_plen_667_part_00